MGFVVIARYHLYEYNNPKREGQIIALLVVRFSGKIGQVSLTLRTSLTKYRSICIRRTRSGFDSEYRAFYVVSYT